MTVRTRIIPTMPDAPFPMGRHVHHDPRSFDYPAATGAIGRDVLWRGYGPRLNQGSLGSCTGNALVDFLMSRPTYKRNRRLAEPDAVRAYSRATVIDPFEGAYPPIDTGSDGISVCQAGVEFGWLTGYDHAFGIDHLLGVLALGPAMVGTTWLEQMFYPDSRGRLTVSGEVAGGHEYLVDGKHGEWLRIMNSWGSNWSVNGYAWIRIADMARLLDDQGDVTVPRPA